MAGPVDVTSTPAKGKGAKGALNSLKANKPLAAAGVGGAVLLALVVRHYRTANSNQVPTAGIAASPYNNVAGDVYNSIQPQLDAIQGEINNLANAQPAASLPAAPPLDPTTLAIATRASAGAAQNAAYAAQHPNDYSFVGGIAPLKAWFDRHPAPPGVSSWAWVAANQAAGKL